MAGKNNKKNIMTDKELYDFVRQTSEVSFRIITPWKIRPQLIRDLYANGWNACVAQIKKNRKNWLKEMDKKFGEEQKKLK